MADIKVLPKEISELIAAGEVVERPASVIKELVENSIDAGATAITVEIEHGGITYMRVTDNGCGIEIDQIKTAFLRHATSKIKTADDLNGILTLGFRGEALASISAVSKIEVLSAVKGKNGVSYEIHGGEEVSFEETGCPDGTTIIVRDLFYNVPARMKFLKKDVSEANTVAAIMDRIALSHPEVAVKLIRDGKTVLNTQGDGKLKSTIYSVLGRDFCSALIPVEYVEDGFKISGFVCMPSRCRPNRNGQFFFLNGRYIKSKTMLAALERAYQNSAMVGKFPACVINLTIPAGTVDVNVHPTKTEVRFTDERRVFDVVYRGTKQAILVGDKRPELQLGTAAKKTFNPFGSDAQFTQTTVDIKAKPQPQIAAIPVQSGQAKETPKPRIYTAGFGVEDSSGAKLHSPSIFMEEDSASEIFKKTSISTSAPRNGEVFINKKTLDIIVDDIIETQVAVENIVDEAHSQPDVSQVVEQDQDKPIYDDRNLNIDAGEICYIGEAFATYIIVSYKESLYLIDKHAAHERINFEKLKAGLEIQSQMLLVPLSVTLMCEEYSAILENLDTLEKIGFIAEDFGGSTVLIRAVPSILSGDDVASLISEIAGNLRDKGTTISDRIDNILHSVACKSAIKAGNITSKDELFSLAVKVITSKSLMYCPHGRPIAFELKRSQIEKQFGRLG